MMSIGAAEQASAWWTVGLWVTGLGLALSVAAVWVLAEEWWDAPAHRRRIAWRALGQMLRRRQIPFFGGSMDGQECDVSWLAYVGCTPLVGVWAGADEEAVDRAARTRGAALGADDEDAVLLGGYLYSALRARFEWYERDAFLARTGGRAQFRQSHPVPVTAYEVDVDGLDRSGYDGWLEGH